jgi:hypothetical protein
MDVSPLNLGIIAAYNNISCQSHFPQSLYLLTVKLSDVTVEVYTLSLKERTKLKGLPEVVSSTAEFETIPIRRHEESLLRRMIASLGFMITRTRTMACVGKKLGCEMWTCATTTLVVLRV